MSKRLPILLQLLESSPNDSFALYAIAKEYENMDDKQQALEYYLRLRAADPAYVGMYYHLGKLYEALQQPDDALNVYNEGIETARRAGDHHALSELNGAKMNLELGL